MARLVVKPPDGPEWEHELGAMTTIGRHPGQSIQVLDRVVSKQHALVTVQGGKFFLTDCDSRNGTFVNNTQLRGKIPLTDGDHIVLGSTELVFYDDRRPTRAPMVTIRAENEAVGTQTSIQTVLEADLSDGAFLPVKDVPSDEALRADYEKLRIAFELNQSIGAELDIDAMLTVILEKAFAVSRADRGSILLVNDEGVLEQRCYRNAKGIEEPIELSQTIISEVCEKHHAVLSSDAQLDDRFGGAQSIIMSGMRSTMCVPLLHKDELLGLIHLDTRRIGNFNQKDLEVLTVFAKQAAMRIAHLRLAKRSESEALVRANLSRLLSPNLVEQVVKGDLALERGGQMRNASVMFIDIRGFTAMSERLEPTDLVALLNEYFEIMVEIVFRHEGTLDKFIGDEIMAVWGAPVGQDDHMLRAARAALEMQASLVRLNEFRKSRGESPIKAGCGINCGEMVAGYMGSTRTLSYTVMGDTVNTA
ncbi:MAG: FHA domain-containing protein, partial [Myxococcales bacterium]|nr:FHA domain-containing protein [Myxococcales bacterium]